MTEITGSITVVIDGESHIHEINNADTTTADLVAAKEAGENPARTLFELSRFGSEAWRYLEDGIRELRRISRRQ
tara:strand:- start:220 stop:441 length:222 start_codon:yes stop_codon:yes gene_type:complete